MKPFIWSVAGTAIFFISMVAWSIAGKEMTNGGDAGVVKGLLIMSVVVGLGASGAVYAARKTIQAIKGPEIQCPVCEGYGQVNKDGGPRGYSAGPFYECVHCKGTGKPQNSK